jgi:hypothetical protein
MELEKIIIQNVLIKLGYNSIHDYFTKNSRDKKVTYNAICRQHRGQSILKKYGHSPWKLFEQIYPEYEWGLTHFQKPNSKKNDPNSNRKILLNVLQKNGFSSFENYYDTSLNIENKIGYDEIMYEVGGSGVLSNCNRSPFNVFTKWVPEFTWSVYMFKNLPQRYFDNDENKRAWLREFEEENNIKTPEDWYEIKSSQIMIKDKGSTLYGKFKSTPILIMRFLYPKFDWKEWLIISGAPNNFWGKKENCLRYLLWLKDEVGFTEEEDWYKLTIRLLIDNNGSGLFDRYNNNLYNLISGIFDMRKWDKNNFTKHNTEKIYREYLNSISKVQYENCYHLQGCVNLRKLYFDAGNDLLDDIHEIDGEQHFRNITYWKSSVCNNVERDVTKMLYALSKGKKIIRISQMDIYKDKINWKSIVKEIISEINIHDTQIYFISFDKHLYDMHIECLLEKNLEIKYKII